MRIVSLVPSLTHTLCELGFESSLVGCTMFCMDPPYLRRKVQSIGGTKTPDIELIRSLKPTHIFTNDEENTAEHIAACEEIAATFHCLPKSPADVVPLFLAMSEFLGGPTDTARRMASELKELLARLPSGNLRKFLYLIWKAPWMAAAGDTYISKTLELFGWVNVVNTNDRYPTLSVEQMISLSPDLILMSSEPFPFRKRDSEFLRKQWSECPEILWIDGQLLSWFGAKTLDCLRQLNGLQTRSACTIVKPL